MRWKKIQRETHSEMYCEGECVAIISNITSSLQYSYFNLPYVMTLLLMSTYTTKVPNWDLRSLIPITPFDQSRTFFASWGLEAIRYALLLKYRPSLSCFCNTDSLPIGSTCRTFFGLSGLKASVMGLAIRSKL